MTAGSLKEKRNIPGYFVQVISVWEPFFCQVVLVPSTCKKPLSITYRGLRKESAAFVYHFFDRRRSGQVECFQAPACSKKMVVSICHSGHEELSFYVQDSSLTVTQRQYIFVAPYCLDDPVLCEQRLCPTGR